jgi:polar amino acid transport system permease protein
MNPTVVEALLQGLRVTLTVTAWSILLGTALAIVGGLASLSTRRWVRWITVVYVEVFRGVAALILLFWAYFALPLAIGIQLPATVAGVLALGTNMGAYGTEIARGAIQSLPKGQTEAAIAVNLTTWQRNRHVILPQALVTMLPPYGNLCIEVMKASALVSVIALNDITRMAQNLRVNRVAPTAEIFLVALLLYFGIALAITGLTRLAERFASRGREVVTSRGK